MKVSLHAIKQCIDFELPSVDELVQRINAQLGGVEEVIDLNAKYKNATIVRVVECEKHPNADKLSSCKIDAGTGELIQVVCGAPNVHVDMWAVWLPPESIVPATFGTDDEFTLGARELRGIISNGMLASSRELAIGDDHDGIVEIVDGDLPEGKELSAGASFADVFGLNDYVIDIENKMFTHRPDLFGQLGVARELAGIFGKQFTSPQWYLDTPNFQVAEGLNLTVFNDAPEKSPRFMAVAIKDVEVKPSPLWLKAALVAMGGKPINNIVDATNYMMLLTAQPTHAYDYDKIRGHKLGVRMAKDSEKVPLLNGKTYELTSDDIVIADSEGAIGLAGIMGGGNSEVSKDTKNIVLEVANFDMYAVRKSSMRHGLFTDALTRFNKGQSPFQNPVVLMALMKMIGGTQASDVYDLGSEEVLEGTGLFVEGIEVTAAFTNARLGLQLGNHDITTLLKNAEIEMYSPDDHDTYLRVHPPFWRTDLEQAEDIVEEVGRLYGYDRLPRELPQRSTKPSLIAPEVLMARSVREAMMRAGANELLTYSFVHERILVAAGQDSEDAYRLSNALSPDLQYYRLSLTPSLLDKVHGNSKAGYDRFALFEIGKSHGKQAGLDEDDLPIEKQQLAAVYAAKDAPGGAPYYQAKTFLSFLAEQLGVTLMYEPLGDGSTSPMTAPFEPKRSAIITDEKSGRFIGIVGEYKQSVTKNFKLPDYAAGFELEIDALVELRKDSVSEYRPLGRYPAVDRDVSFKVADTTAYRRVLSALEDALGKADLSSEVVPVSIYKAENAPTKNIAFRITLTSSEKTLTSQEVNEVIATISAELARSIGAELVQ